MICLGLKSVLPILLRTRSKQRLSILIYHRVLPSFDFMRPDEPTIEQFDWQMELLSRYMKPLSLNDALTLLDDNRLPDNAVCVTFDDGYADNEIHALPILKKWDIPATVFVSTAFLDGGIMWNDSVIEAVRLCGNSLDLTMLGLDIYELPTNESRQKIAHEILKKIKHIDNNRDEYVSSVTSQALTSLPTNLMMTSQQVVNMYKSGIDIGGHTFSHPILAKLNAQDAEKEIINGKKYLESLLGSPVKFFAYPNGQPSKDYNNNHVKIVKNCGFKAAVSTSWGVSSTRTDKYQLARFTPWDKVPEKFLLRLFINQRNII
ncbi:polysaccharide deacetylase family protein [Neptunomonas qingdaonensis]|nr:polysaccharide deacetylase family protein [Neptunomonas qingdaonensis]